MAQLTPRQRDVLNAFRAHVSLTGLSPTLIELGLAVGLSKSATADHVASLVKKGLLERGESNKSRSLKLVGEELVARDDVNDAVDGVMKGKKPDDVVGELGSTLTEAIKAVPNRS